MSDANCRHLAPLGAVPIDTSAPTAPFVIASGEESRQASRLVGVTLDSRRTVGLVVDVPFLTREAGAEARWPVSR